MHVSRARVPVFRETTQTAIEACEAAWEFYGGIFDVLIPDNTKTIVQKADPLNPIVTLGFLEYAQARDFVIDAARSLSGRASLRPPLEALMAGTRARARGLSTAE